MGSVDTPKPNYESVAARSGLKSNWPVAIDISGSGIPARFEGEVGDLIVYGEIPKEINGTFYRVSLDRYLPKEDGIPLDGDGTVSAFRIEDGHVDFKIKYVETERYKLERRAKKVLFGLYKNPWSHHPCVRAAVDSTASTNIIHWADHLLVLEEAANPYEIDPDTLNTLRYDPFYDQVQAKAFTAHPKVDPFKEELVTFGYEAKGPATDDIVTWSIGKDGKKVEELWIKAPFCTMMHDCAITEDYLVLLAWPYEASIERMKAGGHHWAYRYDRPSCFIVVPRRKEYPPPGWTKGEYRVYYWKNCMNIHVAGAWVENGKIYLEATRVHDNVFPFFDSPDGRQPATVTKADFVRWEIDPLQPTESWLPDPPVILDMPSEFPHIDERFTTKKTKIIFMDVFMPEDQDSGTENVFHGLNALAMINTETGEKQYFYAGSKATVQEPAFIPRSVDAVEGDGWVMAITEQSVSGQCELVIIDTRDFGKPVAVAQLPFRIKSQVHGSWVDALGLRTGKSLVAVPAEVRISGKGALEPL
jgi:carotenoid cleavage dioxygenase-like enzyme